MKTESIYRQEAGGGKLETRIATSTRPFLLFSFHLKIKRKRSCWWWTNYSLTSPVQSIPIYFLPRFRFCCCSSHPPAFHRFHRLKTRPSIFSSLSSLRIESQVLCWANQSEFDFDSAEKLTAPKGGATALEMPNKLSASNRLAVM